MSGLKTTRRDASAGLFVFLYITLKQNLMVSLNTLRWLGIINLQSFWVKPTDVESGLMSCTFCIFSAKKKARY